MRSEHKTIKETTDELNYLKEEHQAEFKLILSKIDSTVSEDGEELDYYYALFNEYQLNDPNDLEKKINQILSNKNLKAIFEKGSMLLEIYYTTAARKRRYKPEHVYTYLGYIDVVLWIGEEIPEVEAFNIYDQSCWEIKADNDCNCCGLDY